MVRKKGNNRSGNFFENLALKLTQFSGSTPAFIISFSLIIAWALTGPFFNFSDVWQLVINTGTTIITFLMVFLIQRAQNKDSLAIHMKLNEIIASINGASNMLVDIEEISEDDLNTIKRHYQKLARLYEAEKNIKQSHSIEEAEKRHKRKVSKK
jgi:low affinity Fe/Cu permease